MARYLYLNEGDMGHVPNGADISKGKNGYIMAAGNPRIVENNVALFRQLPLMDESVGSRGRNTAAYSAWIDERDGRVLCFNNEVQGYMATFKCQLDFRHPMKVLGIYTHGFWGGGTLLQKPLEEDTVLPDEAKASLFETAYRMNVHFEEMFREFKGRRGCLSMLWPGNWL